jgi:GDSL-like Lipase/Acylhydrolase family
VRKPTIVMLVAVPTLLIAGELWARFGLGLGDPPLSQAHPTIEYYFRPNQQVHRFGNLFQTNRYGMRSEDFPPRKADPAELRVLIYGDSVVNGGNLTDQSHLATTLLRDALARELRRPVIVGNVSAGSWGPPNELAYLRQFGFLDADVIVLVLSSHDYNDAPTFDPLNPLTHPTEKPFSALWEGVTRYLPRYFTRTGINESGALPDSSAVANERDIEVSLAAEREFLNSAQAHDVKVLVVQHLTETELKSQQPLPGFAQIRQIAQEVAAPVIDDAAVLRERLQSGNNPYRDDIHINDAGQKALEELLLREITSRFLTQRQPR